MSSGSVMQACTHYAKENSYEIQFERGTNSYKVDTVSDYTFLTSGSNESSVTSFGIQYAVG